MVGVATTANSAPAYASAGSVVALRSSSRFPALASARNRSISASRMGLSPRFTASTFEGTTSSARTSLRCASSTARERPTYPRPATAILMSISYSVFKVPVK